MTHEAAFNQHTIQIEGVNTRVAQATCSYCHATATVRNNTQAYGVPDDVAQKRVAVKFERLGWKISRNPAHHLCPQCFGRIKMAAVRKKGAPVEKEKVVPIAPRSPSRDEKRIIFLKIDEVYVGEMVGYSGDWSDEKIAEDLKVPLAWVAAIREENFGPNISEALTKAEADVSAFMAEVAVVKEAMAILDQRAEQLIKKLEQLRRRD